MFNEKLFSDDGGQGREASPRTNILKIRDSAYRFIQQFRKGVYENLYFFGRAGTGKTFMAASIADELMRSGASALYLSSLSLFDMITEHRLRSVRDDGYRDSAYRRLYASKLLVIDDFGTEPMTDARYSEFVVLLNERLAPGAGKSTILSTNMDLNDIKTRYDERLFSRVLGSFIIIRFYGDDVRFTRKAAL